MRVAASPELAHLDRLSDRRGLFEHAALTIRREEHGYCTDDNARLLVVTSLEADVGSAHHLSRMALDFVLDAQAPDGRFRNRMDRSGRWTDQPSTDDCWGRGLMGLGVAAARHVDPAVRARAQRGFDDGVGQRSRWSRAMAFATLGAVEVLEIDPDHRPARELLGDALELIGEPISTWWVWPEPRLTYANATLAEAVIAAGAALGRPDDLARGLRMLTFLLELETRLDHLSVTGVGGRGPDVRGPQFDQQPIEVAAMADACWRAFSLTGDPLWSNGVIMSSRWFEGDNDTGLVMHDPISGGGYDGLQPVGVNLNQGAESTLAFISTRQRANSFAAAS